MKLTISTEKDINCLNGKWVVQLDNNNNNPDVDITDSKNWNFYSEKRISLVIGKMMVGLYYIHSNHIHDDLFIECFNNPNKDGTRFYRLLTSREIDHLCKHFRANII